MKKKILLNECDWGEYSKEEAFLIAKLNNISQSVLISRMKSGWKVETAITMPVKEKPRFTQVTNYIPIGTTIKYWRERCEDNDVKWKTFYHRVITGKWDCELACTMKAKETPDMITIRKKFHFWKKIDGEWQRLFEWVTFKTSAEDYFRWE
jgi:hypothetical protein